MEGCDMDLLPWRTLASGNQAEPTQGIQTNRGRHIADVGCLEQNEKVGTSFPWLPKWHLHKFLLN